MHRWVILKVPSWGSEDEAIRGMTAQEFRRLRNKANKGLDQYAKRLYEDHDAFVYGPNLVLHARFRRTKYGEPTVHLDYRSQTMFIDQVIEAVARIVCQCCCPFTKRKRERKEHSQLYDRKLVCPGAKINLENFKHRHYPEYE